MIEAFMILSERCSGSHFVQYALLENFKIAYLKRHHKRRHFFGHEDDVPSYTDEEKQTTLMVCVVRDPVEWVDSFFKRKHHVPPENKYDIERFLKSEWYSIYEEGEKKGTEIMEDRDMNMNISMNVNSINTKTRYRNLLALREAKHDYFLRLESSRSPFPHVLVLRYEDLRDHYEATLDLIGERFQLSRKNNKYKKIDRYKGTYTALYQKKPILLSDEIQAYIRTHVNLEQEQRLGYCVEVGDRSGGRPVERVPDQKTVDGRGVVGTRELV